MWLWVVLLVVVIGAIAVLAAGRDDVMVDVYDDRPDALLPAGRMLTAADLAAVRLSTAVRGYRMDEVDALLARMHADLEARAAQESAPPVDQGPATEWEPVTEGQAQPELEPVTEREAELEWGQVTELRAEPVEEPEPVRSPESPQL